MANESILVVDDNPANCRLASFLLASKGYKVRTAASADEALAALAEEVPRLILMDLQLPGMDGLTLTRRLKSDPRTRDTLIVAVTAYAMKGDEARAREAGCDAYITKPIDTRTLPLQIAEYLAAGVRTEGNRDGDGDDSAR
jgi:two-component system cell cycle response regulator DivK